MFLWNQLSMNGHMHHQLATADSPNLGLHNIEFSSAAVSNELRRNSLRLLSAPIAVRTPETLPMDRVLISQVTSGTRTHEHLTLRWIVPACNQWGDCWQD